MKTVLSTLIIIHGLIHLAGFSRAFDLEAINQLTQNISRINGIFWLAAAVCFIITALLFFLNKQQWWMLSVFAILLSQYLLFTSWHDTKFGTIANIIILVATITGYGTWAFSNKYKNEVTNYLNQAVSVPDSVLIETDIRNLPDPVKKYLHYTGAIGKPKVKNFKVEFSGQEE